MQQLNFAVVAQKQSVCFSEHLRMFWASQDVCLSHYTYEFVTASLVTLVNTLYPTNSNSRNNSISALIFYRKHPRCPLVKKWVNKFDVVTWRNIMQQSEWMIRFTCPNMNGARKKSRVEKASCRMLIQSDAIYVVCFSTYKIKLFIRYRRIQM